MTNAAREDTRPPDGKRQWITTVINECASSDGGFVRNLPFAMADFVVARQRPPSACGGAVNGGVRGAPAPPSGSGSKGDVSRISNFFDFPLDFPTRVMINSFFPKWSKPITPMRNTSRGWDVPQNGYRRSNE